MPFVTERNILIVVNDFGGVEFPECCDHHGNEMAFTPAEWAEVVQAILDGQIDKHLRRIGRMDLFPGPVAVTRS